MLNFILFTIIVALIASFIVLLLNKVGVLEWMQIKGNEFISKMANCHFCLSFWVALIISIFIAFYFQNPILILVPICSTPITRILL